MAPALQVKLLKVATNLRKTVMHFRDTRLLNLKVTLHTLHIVWKPSLLIKGAGDWLPQIWQ